MTSLLDPSSVIAGGSTITLAIAAFRLLYRALREERERIALLGDKYTQEIERLQTSHAAEREGWHRESEYFQAEIEALRRQVSELYAKLYKFGIETP